MTNELLTRNEQSTLVGGDDTSLLKNHNIRVYYDLKNLLSEYQSVCLETCTGSGKSYVSSQLIKNHYQKAFIVVPTLAIESQWRDLFNAYDIDAEIITYVSYYMSNDAFLEATKDYLWVYDEVHHIGAEVWGHNYTVQKSMGVKQLGLSTDTRRWTDGGRDVAEEFFDYKYIGYPLPDAIDLNVVNSFEYIGAAYDYTFTRKIRGSKDKAIQQASELIGKLDLLTNKDAIIDIINRHLTDDDKKILVFCDDINNIKLAEEICSAICSKENILQINWTMAGKYKQVLDDFKNRTERVALLSVNILNEGVHVSNADTAIMLRRTNSPNVFFQQLGRVLSSDTKKRVKVFDLVCNLYNLNFAGSETTVGSIEQLNSRIKSISNQIILHDYTKDIIDVLRKIEELRVCYNPWLDWEKDILREWYPKEGGAIVARLPRHSIESIRTMASALGLKFYVQESKYDDVIIEHWNKKDRKKIYSQLIPDMTYSQVYERAKSLGCEMKHTDAWLSEENKIVRDNKDEKISVVCDMLNALECNIARNVIRTYSAVTSHRSQMGISDNEEWSEQDRITMSEYYETFGYETNELLERPRTKSAMQQFAKKNGLLYDNGLAIDDVLLEKSFQEFGWDIDKYPDSLKKFSKSALCSHLNKLGHLRKVAGGKWNYEECMPIVLEVGYNMDEYKRRFPDRTEEAIRSMVKRVHNMLIEKGYTHHNDGTKFRGVK